MRSLFRYIRQQPTHVRERYALGIAASFTGVVVLLWGVARFDAAPVIAPGRVAEEERTAFSTLIKNTKAQFAALQAALSSSSASTTTEVAPPAPQDPTAIVLSPEEVAALAEKAASSSPTPPPPSYTEVMIGTTSASTTVSASSSTSE